MPTIRAPFNFVPLSEKILFPDWADKISHDIPFEDGVSGEISLKITAKTPIFVRNGHASDVEDSSFSHIGSDDYFIPATSIKGAIRNVLEIMSFSKMNNVDNQSFGIRDLSKGADGIFYRNKIQTENIRCGWLVKINDDYFLDDCSHPWRVSLDDIDNEYQTGLADFAYTGDLKDADGYNRTARKKYELFGNNDLHNCFVPDDETRERLKVGNRQFVHFDEDGDGGTIVFTGQSSNRKKKKKDGKVVKNKKGEEVWEGKFFEFVIPDKISKSNIRVNDFVIKEFLSIHQNSPDFKDFRKQQLNEGKRIPVFFKYDDNDGIESIGLSYMYKLPAFNSIYNAMPSDFLSEKLDLSECIFGTECKNNALKGRVQFSTAWADKTTVVKKPSLPMLLSAPHPSYYPLYLGNGQTWNSEKIRIAGRKRYPVRDVSDMLSPTSGTPDMMSEIIPLKEGVVFNSTIRFFNLKEVELGALLMALTFKNQGDCFHSLGMAKPLGYGSVRIDVALPEYLTHKDYISVYSRFMESKFGSCWENQLEELYLMARGIPKGRGAEFTYMTMDTKYSEFKDGKDKYANGEQLGKFSEIISSCVPQCQYIGSVSESIKRINLEREIAERKEKLEKWNSLFEEAVSLFGKDQLPECRNKIAEIESISIFSSDLDEKLSEFKQSIDNKVLAWSNDLKGQVLALKESGDYNSAMALIDDNLALVDLSYIKQGIECELKRREQSFKDFLYDCSDSVPLKNLPNYLKKWKGFNTLSDEDCKVVSDFVRVRYPNVKISQKIKEAFLKVMSEALFAKIFE